MPKGWGLRQALTDARQCGVSRRAFSARRRPATPAPHSLAELVPDRLPAIPADPFDGQPLRYRRLPQGFTVYSVGPDFTDNGGQRQPARTEQADGYDVVFTVER